MRLPKGLGNQPFCVTRAIGEVAGVFGAGGRSLELGWIAGPASSANGLAETIAAAGPLAVVACASGGPYEALAQALAPPRVVLFDAAAGPMVDAIVDSVYLALEPGDVVVDLSPSWWCDTLRRYRRMRHRAIYYLDGARLGPSDKAAWLIAGDAPGVELAAPPLRAVCADRLRRVGGPGAAHFTAMLASAAASVRDAAALELLQLLEAYPLGIDLAAASASLAMPDLTVDGRGGWLPETALQLEAPAPLIGLALMLEQVAALDEQRRRLPPPRQGGWIDIDEVV